MLLFRDDFRLPGHDGQAKERKRLDDKWKLQERSHFAEANDSTHHHGRPSTPASTEGESPTADAAAVAATSPACGNVDLLTALRAQHEEHQASAQAQQTIAQAQHEKHTAEMAKLRSLILTLKR